jgi:hypothetical protein
MDSFGALKRRTTEMLETVQKSVPERPAIGMPAMPAMPAMPSMPGMPAMANVAALARAAPYKATWEPILDGRLPRASHSGDVVSGTAYIFGGETEPRRPVNNVVHAVTLPMSSAPADYLKIPAKAAAEEEEEKQDAVAARPDGDDEAENETPEAASEPKDRELSDVPLGNSAEDDVGSSAGAKGKGRARANVPAPRVGHATAVIGARIFVFGGRGGPEFTPIDEAGRVWVFDTRSHLWSHLDPAAPAPGVAEPRYPAARSYHCATATEFPRDFGSSRPSKTWKQWAEGDSAIVGTPQAPIVGNLAAQAKDEESDGYGTFVVHGGCLADGGRASDVWAFDVHSRVWSELPSAPGSPRGGAAICISKNQSRLFRFGGFDGEEIGGRLDYIDLAVEVIDDAVSHGEVALSTRSSWQTITPAVEQRHGHAHRPSQASIPEAAPLAGGPAADAPAQEWPGARSVAGFECITVGGGRELLILVMGERTPSAAGHSAAGTFWDDVWVFRAPAKGGVSVASVAGSLKGLWSRASRAATGAAHRVKAPPSPAANTTHAGQGSWARVDTRPVDPDYEGDDEYDGDRVPRARGWFGMSTLGDVEGAGVVLWGGVRADNKRLADGWILRLD